MKKVLGVKECVELYAQKRGITKLQAKEEFETALDTIADGCVQGGVSFRGMFSLKSKVRKGREGTINNIPYVSEDRNTLKFSIGKKLEEALNE